MRRHRLLILFLALPMSDAGELTAQRHAHTDRALASSILAGTLPFPSSAHGPLNARTIPDFVLRADAQYSRSVAAAPGSVLVLGIRSDFTGDDGSGLTTGGFGAKLGVRRSAADEAVALYAGEVNAGIRTLGYLARPSWPDVGLDVAFGWSIGDDDATRTFGVRLPVEFVRAGRAGWLSVAVAPTVAWGDIRLRTCDDRGPGDNGGDLGVQFHLGRTRFLMAGGASLGLEPAGISLTIGTQHMLAAGQRPRLMLGIGWSP